MTRIVIIEDDQVIAQMYRMKFESDGFDVHVTNNGIDGIKLVEKVAPNLLLLDLQMPHMSGTEVLEKIRSYDWGKTIPVIILTNLGEEEAPKHLRSLGIESYIVKADLTPRQVVDRVKTTLQLA